GIVTQVTLKLTPESDEKAAVLVGCQSQELDAVLQLLHDTRTRPAAIDLFNRNAAAYINKQSRVGVPENHWLLVIAFEGNGRAVKWQVEQLVKELSTQKCEVCGPVQDATDWLLRVMTEFQSNSDARLTVKANLLPHATADFCKRVDSLSE